MSLRARTASLAYYRLTFIYLIFATGIIGLCVLTLEAIGLSIIYIEPGTSYDAIIATSWAGSVICFSLGMVMHQLSKQRRKAKRDRRQRNIPIDFPDRRKGDRRASHA